MTQSNEWVFDPSLIEEQKAVVKIEADGVDWYMEFDDWNLAEEEGRTKPVIYGEKLIMVDDETYEELKKLEEWLKENK